MTSHELESVASREGDKNPVVVLGHSNHCGLQSLSGSTFQDLRSPRRRRFLKPVSLVGGAVLDTNYGSQVGGIIGVGDRRSLQKDRGSQSRPRFAHTSGYLTLLDVSRSRRSVPLQG